MPDRSKRLLKLLVLATPFVLVVSGCGGPGGGASAKRSASSQPVTIRVTPSSINVFTGSAQQFTAIVTGTDNTAVTWTVNGVAGGNATFGTISASGLYTAPAAVPGPNRVSIAARSVADTTKSASAKVTVLPALPAATPS